MTYHQVILAELDGDGERRTRKYYKERTSWLIVALKRVPMREEYTIFENLQMEVKKPMCPKQEMVMWISEATWMLSGHRTSLGRKHPLDHRDISTEKMRFHAELQQDRRQRVSTTGVEI